MFLLDTGEEPNISTRSKDIMQWSKEQVSAILGIPLIDTGDIALENLQEFIEGNEYSLLDFNTISPNWNKW